MLSSYDLSMLVCLEQCSCQNVEQPEVASCLQICIWVEELSTGSQSRGNPHTQRLILQTLHLDMWNPYIDQFLRRFSVDPLVIRIGNGDHVCRTDPESESLSCDGMEKIAFRPSPADIFGCASGPFGRPHTRGDAKSIMTNICAGFNRGNILDLARDGGATESEPYKNPVHNAYAKAMHLNEHDGIGYGFPYDDVAVDGLAVDGTLTFGANEVKELTIYVGGIHSPLHPGNSVAP